MMNHRKITHSIAPPPPLHKYSTDDGRFQSVVKYDETPGCVMYARLVRWYDPIEKIERSKLDEEIFIIDASTM